MALRVRRFWLPIFLSLSSCAAHAADARFDLVGPRIDVRVTRTDASGTPQTLPIAAVPNLQPGDRIWLHPDLPASQSVKYLLICVFLRGTTNPPPESWFLRIPTWDRKVRAEGTFVTVPDEAQQAILFMAPETGGDFATLKSAVQGRPGAFVRAQQDLTEAGFEQARIEKYVASIRRVPPSDPAELQKHSDLLSRTLALKPNADCFKRPVDVQFTCLTQTGTQTVLDDGHGQTLASTLSTGPNSDLIQATAATSLGGSGLYSAYVGAIVDLVRVLGNLHTAQYQYIPAISFPQGEALNLRLNTPPSFHNPKSVLVVALPPVEPATPPALRPADAAQVACLLKPSVVLAIEGAPLLFSTDFGHNLILHLNTASDAAPQADIPLAADPYYGGFTLQRGLEHHVPIRDPLTTRSQSTGSSATLSTGAAQPSAPAPVLLTGTIEGRWGFDAFTGPTVRLQQLPGTGWHLIDSPDPIAGHPAQLLLTSTGTACVHTITAQPSGTGAAELSVDFKPTPSATDPNLLSLSLPLERDLAPGDLHLAIQQFEQPRADDVSTRTFSEPARVTAIDLHAADRSLLLHGDRLAQVDRLNLGDLVFTPVPGTASAGSVTFALPAGAPPPPTRADDHLTARLHLTDGRTLTVPVSVSAARPSLKLLLRSIDPAPLDPAHPVPLTLSSPDDLPLSSRLTFTLRTSTVFPRTGQIEIETLDGTLRTVLTLAPSGGLMLQDPHIIVATLDPGRSFGPSAFGALHVRAVYPASSRPDDTPPASDWLPLVTLVRLPVLTGLACPTDPAQPCTLSGSNLFLVQTVGSDPAFTDATPVPDGFTGSTLAIRRPPTGTLFLHLRDDPSSLGSAVFSSPPRPRTHAPEQP